MIKGINKSNFYKSKKNIRDRRTWCWQNIGFKKKPYATNKSTKYFIGYNNADVMKPLNVKLRQMIGYVEHFDSIKTMSFKINDNRL